MSVLQGTAGTARTITDPAASLTVGDVVRLRIADQIAYFAAERLECELDVPMTDEVFLAVTETLAPQLDAMLAALTLPPIQSGLIGGPAESEVA
jgi:hypothetical protein